MNRVSVGGFGCDPPTLLHVEHRRQSADAPRRMNAERRLEGDRDLRRLVDLQRASHARMMRYGRSLSQCRTLRRNCGFCAAPGSFIPIGARFGPVTWAENIAASPNAATRPLPNGMTAPCSRPRADSL